MTSSLLHPQITRLVGRYPDLEPCAPDVQAAYAMLVACFKQAGKVLLCGNGGSAADCEHIVGELMKGFMSKRPVPRDFQDRLVAAYGDDGATLGAKLQGTLPAISLTSQSALQFAYTNDVAPELVFAQQVYGYGRAGDVLWALSTSGNSKNVVHAVQVAKALGLGTIALTGQSGGKLAGLADVVMRVPSDCTPDIQERHLPIYHALCLGLEQEFFPA